MKKRLDQAEEPMGCVEINGVTHKVPASRVELEELIAAGATVEREITEQEERISAKGAALRQQIKDFEGIVAQLKGDLAGLVAPETAALEAKRTKLDEIKSKILKLARPLMGHQKSMKITGLGGAVQVERTPKMEVEPTQLDALRKLLGDKFSAYFEVKEIAKPLAKAWELLTTLKGRQLSTFSAAVATSESGRVKFLAGDGKQV